MNSPREAFLPYALVALVAVLLPLPASAGIKCWTNNEGVRECGNVVPPEHAQQGYHALSNSGVTLGVTSRAKTKEELRVERAEAAREAVTRAEEARMRRERDMKDRVLLSTFTNEKDLTIAHEGQIAAIEIRIEHTEQILKQLKRSLETLRTQAAKRERNGQPITPELENKIARIERQLLGSHNFIEQRRLQKADLAAQFVEDLGRYRELKGFNAKSD